MLKRVGFFLFFILASVHRTSADSSFFEDKTIRLVLGFSPGGISDLWARALARRAWNVACYSRQLFEEDGQVRDFNSFLD